jgi:aspartate aminotransferase
MEARMKISKYMYESIERASLVRKMFDEGLKLKKEHGEDKVFDYSLGNPDLKPPVKFETKLVDLVRKSEGKGHGYMPNAGFLDVREALASQLSHTIGANMSDLIKPDMLVMTVGAAGALNVMLKTILDPGDNVVVLAPYFMEYNFYAENHGGRVKPAQTTLTFRPDTFSLSEAIDEKTKAVLINSPNNPTGAVYTRTELMGIADILDRKNKNRTRPIYLISDEPYRKIVFVGQKPASIFGYYRNSVIISSFSKDLSIPGERIGYLCLNPRMDNWPEVAAAASMANRILGFVNAPALMQRVVPELFQEVVNVSIYQKRIEFLCDKLKRMGYKLTEPEGAFYIFPQSPLKNDRDFVDILKEELILAVPGSGFGREGYFRLSLCLDEAKIDRSLPGFERALAKGEAEAKRLVS